MHPLLHLNSTALCRPLIEEVSFSNQAANSKKRSKKFHTKGQKPRHPIQLLKNEPNHVAIRLLGPIATSIVLCSQFNCQCRDGVEQECRHSSESNRCCNHEQHDYCSDVIGGLGFRRVQNRIHVQFPASTNYPNAQNVVKQ